MNQYKEPIRLRKRVLKTGNTSLYFDIYLNGKRSYEFLGLYLIPEKTRADREKNRETIKLADAIRAQRIIDLQNGRFGFGNGRKPGTNFLAYFKSLRDQRHVESGSRSNWRIWNGALKHLERYCAPAMTFRDVTPDFVRGFKEYLNKAVCSNDRRKEPSKALTAKPLSSASKSIYFGTLRTCLKQAIDDGIITTNPMHGVEGFKIEERERVYLTLDEVRALAATPCPKECVKKAFLFSCMTGLRISDIEKMKWSEIRQQGEFTRIVFRQKKTGGQEYMDVSPQAATLLGERRHPESRVFSSFRYSTSALADLRKWAGSAGVDKDITFHSGRHTFAVMMLDLGADIYTVQKLLGHKEIQTTQIYAKVMDKKKQEAAMLIPPILPTAGDGQSEK